MILRLLLVGLAALAIASSVIAWRPLANDRSTISAAVEPARVIGPGNVTVAVAPETPVALSQPSDPPAQAPASVGGMRITIPRLGIDLPLDVGDIGRDVPRSGYAGGTPEAVALLFPGTSIPGTGGNAYIYAHARKGMFLSLWDARIDDAVFVVRDDRSVVRAYRIALVLRRVDPTDTSWLDSSGPERLTLQTSTGPGPADPRFIAVAYLTDPLTERLSRP